MSILKKSQYFLLFFILSGVPSLKPIDGIQFKDPLKSPLAAQAVLFLMGTFVRRAAESLSKSGVHTAAHVIKSLVTSDSKTPLTTLIEQEKRTVSKGAESSIKKAVSIFLQKHLLGTPTEIRKFLEAFNAGVDSAYVYDFVTNGYDYLSKVGSTARLNELSKIGIDYAQRIINSFVAAYPEFRNDLLYPIKTYHGTALYCGQQDPYCLQSAGPVQKPLDLTAIQIPVNDIVRAFTESLTFENMDPLAAGFIFAIVSFDFATALSPLLVQGLLDPKDYKITYTLINKFVEKWLSSEVYDAMARWYKESTINKNEITEKDLEKRIKLGTLTRVVQTTAAPSETTFVKNLLESLHVMHLFK